MTSSVGVDPTAHVALVVDPAASRLEIGDVGLGAGTVAAQLRQRQTRRPIQEPRLRIRIRRCRVRNRRGLLHRELPTPRRRGRCGQVTQPLPGLDGLHRLPHRRPGSAGQLMGGCAVAVALPLPRLRDPRRGQGFHRGGHVLDRHRVVEDRRRRRSRPPAPRRSGPRPPSSPREPARTCPNHTEHTFDLQLGEPRKQERRPPTFRVRWHLAGHAERQLCARGRSTRWPISLR